jgi:hypothetical protein
MCAPAAIVYVWFAVTMFSAVFEICPLSFICACACGVGFLNCASDEQMFVCHELTRAMIHCSRNKPDQWPEIAEDTSTRPPATNLSLQVTVAGLTAGQRFILCRYECADTTLHTRTRAASEIVTHAFHHHQSVLNTYDHS